MLPMSFHAAFSEGKEREGIGEGESFFLSSELFDAPSAGIFQSGKK